MEYMTIKDRIGGTPLVKLTGFKTGSNTVLLKLEGDNPAGSVKDRPAFNMINQAQKRGEIKPGDTLVEATSGNTGIALAMAASIMGYRMVLTMPENASSERIAIMKAYGAKVILTPKMDGMEGAIDKAREMESGGEGVVLNQFGNPDNPDAHYRTTGPEIWQDTGGKVTHFFSAMGTTGTIMGVSRYLKEQNSSIQIVGVQPDEGASIPGIRKWPKEYLPTIYEPSRVDRLVSVTQEEAEETCRQLARKEGIFCGISSGGCTAAILKEINQLENSLIVGIVCDRGDKYLSTGVFPGND